MKQRKVLYVAKTSRGGSASSLYHLVRALDDRRYKPIVLFHVQEDTFIGDKLDKAGIQTIIVEKQSPVFPRSAKPVKPRDIGGWLQMHVGQWAGLVYVSLKAFYEFVRWEAPAIWPIVRAIHANDIDLVHLNNGLCHNRAGITAAWLTRTRCICHVRGFDRLNFFDKLFEHFVSTFIYISRAVAEDYIAQGIRADKGIVIHNAVDLRDFSLVYDVESVRSEFGATCNERWAGVVGRLDWWKGHEYFLEAMALVARQIPNVRGLIIGEPEDTPQNLAYYQKLESLTKSLGLESRVIFTGFRSDIARLLSALDVVVLSSSAPEPFGRVVIEGMAAGKPIVATAAGGVLDIVEDGVNGLLVPPCDPATMAAAILSLLTDRERARRLGEAGRRQVSDKFTIQQHAAAVQDVYEAVCAQTRPGLNSK